MTLNGTTPAGDHFTAGPYSVYPDGSGGAYLYIFYNYGLGDAGDYSFAMSYNGDSNFQASVSAAALALSVQPLPTVMTVAGPVKLLTGNSAVITGQLASPIFSGVYLSGPVEFYDGVTLLQENYVWSNSFLFVLPLSTPGLHNISARFKGLLGSYNVFNTAASASNVVSVDVYDRNQQPAGTIQLSVTPDPLIDDTAVSLLATVTNTISQNLGTVTFFDGSTSFGTVAVTGSNAVGGHAAGTATLKRNFGAGKHTITARYDGVASMTPSGAQTLVPVTSAQHELLVTAQAPSDTHLTARSSASNGRAFDLAATIFAYGAVAPTGILTFYDTTANLQIGSVAIDDTDAAPGFGESRSIPVVGQADSVVAADFNGDGLMDLAVTDTASNAVHVLLGTGKGTYNAQKDYALDGVPVLITTNDINRDGVPDIVVGTADRHIDLLPGNPDGTFQSVREISLSFVPGRILFGDLNGDGSTDMVVVGQAGSTSLAVLPGNGDGNFGAPRTYTIPKLWGGNSAILADLNADGVLDVLLVTDNYATYEMLGIGDGTLQPAILFNAMNGNVIAADLNGDGVVDLAFINSSGLVGVQLGRGDGAFTPPRYYTNDLSVINPVGEAEPCPTALPIAAADFNGDGIPDIVVPGMILLGVGDGTFRQSPSQYGGTFSALADINGDGFPDLVNTSQGTLNVQYGGTVVSAKLNGANVRGAGMHSINAVYAPSDGMPYAASTSNAIHLQAVQTVGSQLTLVKSSPVAGNPTYGDPVTVHATVAPTGGSDSPTGSVVFTVDGTPQQLAVLSSSARCQAVFDNLSGGPHSLTAEYSGDLSFAPSSDSLTITVRPASVTVALASSLVIADLGESITFKATVQPQSGTAFPTGTVTFQEGSTALGTVPLSDGVATYTTTALSAGSHALGSSYSGDSNFQTTSSAPLTQTVVAPDFIVVSSPSLISIQRGHSASAVISITAVGGYSGAVTLACANLTSETTCAFVPSRLDVTGGTPAQTATLTVSIADQKLVAANRADSHSQVAALAALLVGFPLVMCAGTGRLNRNRSKKRLLIGSLAVMLGTTTWIIGCGSAPSPPSTCNVSVTVADGNVSHMLPLTVVVR